MVQNFRLFLFTFFTIGIISFILARKITLPVRKFNAIADNIEAGVKDISFPNFTDKTMSRVADIFYRIYNTMNNKQNELENERYKLQHIFSILDEGIILLDNDYRLKYFNSKAIEHLGVGLTTGKNIVDSVNNMDVINFIIEILNSKTDSIIQLDLRMKKFEAHLRYLDDEMLIVLYNITERTQYEAFKTELIGNITHELKTPLAMIMGYAETLLNNTSVDKQNLEKFLGIIHNNSKRLNNIINDILELHRLEHSPEGFTVDEPLQLDTLFGELMDRYEGFESKTVMQSNCKEILMLREHVMTLVTNLVDNAHKYSHSNVVEVSIRKRDTEMIIEVADEGPVIPEEEKKRIFERFYTVNKSKNRNQTGTGLGLSIVKHIASLYDGSVTLHQNHKGGNTFTITAFERPVRSLPADEDGDGENFRL
jgi:two-component system phosphate regulon sensor histidine kinase PhoR